MLHVNFYSLLTVEDILLAHMNCIISVRLDVPFFILDIANIVYVMKYCMYDYNASPNSTS